MSAGKIRHPKILRTSETGLLVIDIQQRIIGVINEHERVVSSALKLIEGFKALELPIFYTEQYPRGLGETVPELKDALGDREAYQKMTFSCVGCDDDLFAKLKKENITQVVIAGIESHVCVQQTVLDLLANGFQVNVAADAVSSRKEIDYVHALRRMEKHGAEVTTAEVVLFELLYESGTPQFKAVSKIVK